MEKGNVIASSSKSNPSEPKNKPDVANKHLHLPRVKDSASPRPDGRRKSNPQRSQECFDKRPRNRGNANYGRYRDEMIANEGVTDPSIKRGCKKTSLNHLLNFHLAEKGEHWEGKGNRSTYNRLKLPKYNKELFLQANCQFIAKNNGDYKVHEINPDKLVEWSLIEEICLPCHEVPLCPICLYVPVAAKITRCGHVYCWPCMLHYLALTDKTWQKCPICFEAVHKADLKSVSIQVKKCFVVGDEITMCLMKREKGTLHVSRITSQNTSPVICNANKGDETTRYKKLILASQEEVQCILNRERFELEEAYVREKDTPEACFIESALKFLLERESSNVNLVKHLGNNRNEETEKNINIPARKHLTSTSSVDSIEGSINSDMNKNISKLGDFSESSATHISESDKGLSFFYQAEDGQHIYLHNINVRMLIKEYGSLENAPPIITAKIVEMERVSMTEVLRKRLRYLQHLPLTCEFQVVELSFSKEVSPTTLQQFEKEINDRSLVRNKKARNERRREKMIEREENKKLGKYPKANYNLNSVDQFPVYNPDDFNDPQLKPEDAEGHNSDDDISLLNSRLDSASLTAASEDTCVASSASSFTSFAQLLKDGKTFSSSPKEVKTVDSALELQSDISYEESYLPQYNQSFSDAFQAALDSVSLSNTSNNSSKKKKRRQHQVLVSNSMCRGKN